MSILNACKIFACLCVAGVASIRSSELSAAVSLAPPNVETVRERTMAFVAAQGIKDKVLVDELATLWNIGTEPRSASEMFELTIKTFGIADPETQSLVDICRLTPATAGAAPQTHLLARVESGTFYRANIALFYGRYLVHRQMYEEGLEVLASVSVNDVVDPAGLLFFKAVCQHDLLLKKEGLETIAQLLKGTEGVPVRYSSVATLMQYDLENLQEKTLDEVSRKMTDVERRLTLGRAGQKVQKREDEIVATLDELIKKIEEQNGGGGGGGDGGAQNQSAQGANDSRVKGATAPGKVDPKKLKPEGGWGSLPPKSRARAKDLIARDFPAHYRQAIEAYTKKVANRPANSGK